MPAKTEKLIGCDLEFAVKDRESHKFVPAGVLDCKGVKGSPEPYEYGGVEIDCCALEITPNPAHTEDQFVQNIVAMTDLIKKKYDKHDFVCVPSCRFDEMILNIIPQAKEFGCSPDFNAWTMKRNPKPEPPEGLRSFGGHIHLSGATRTTVKALDLIVGMWSVIMDPDRDRRKLYGRAGAYRPKKYGIEYRVLSNFWCDRAHLIREAYRYTRMASRLTPTEIYDNVNRYGGPDEIQDVINTSDVYRARLIHEGVKNFYYKKLNNETR